jgi:HSP20 family protein
MEIVEKDDALIVTAELPGVAMKDVDITLEDSVLTIRGEKKEEKKEAEEGRYHMWERRYGSFQRAFTLPKAVDAATITAKFESGVLTVLLPKTEKAKVQGRKIPIANGK